MAFLSEGNRCTSLERKIMRYQVFVTDYDGTLAQHDQVTSKTIQALKRLKATGRKMILATGRRLEDLKSVFPEYGLFDRIVAENGALIYRPFTLDMKLLGERPPEHFIQSLQQRNIPILLGHVIVASWEPHQHAILEMIRKNGLEYQVIFNKGAVMVLPPAINKATGLKEALNELGAGMHNTVAIGDAENDNAMLRTVECGVAVYNALPQVKTNADWTTVSSNGEGVTELIDRLLIDDLKSLDKRLTRHYLEIGIQLDSQPFGISPYGSNLLLAGSSGFGKTTLSAAFIEKLIAKQYQFCIIDPEGDYNDFPGVVSIGNSMQPPVIEEVMDLLKHVEENVVVCILAIPLNDRPAFFRKLFHLILELRIQTARPHFLIMDEVHHLMPKEYSSDYFNIPKDFSNFLAITTQPRLLNQSFLERVNIAMIMGDSPEEGLRTFTKLINTTIDLPDQLKFQKGDVLVWQKGNNNTQIIKGNIPKHLLMRHKRKYATGDMANSSFFFKGPNNRLNLKANNLMIFIQMASGIDDETWMYHLLNHDYSKWFRYAIKDDSLASEVEHIESIDIAADTSRKAIFSAIMERYTAPA